MDRSGSDQDCQGEDGGLAANERDMGVHRERSLVSGRV
jgi:hypothetical protein